MSERIVPMSEVDVHVRCPDCHSTAIERDATRQDHLVSMNGATLWTLVEKCRMCSWFRVIENVKIGA